MGRGYLICQGICIGSVGNIPLFQPPWYDKRPPPFSTWSDVPPHFWPGTTNDPYIFIYGVELCTFMAPDARRMQP